MATARDLARTQLQADIRRVARAHLASDGAAGLSLRAVARDLGMVSSAIYRYVGSRDALLTLLILDAYDELGEAAEQADRSARRRTPHGRWRAVTRAVREWSITHPAEYALIYGTPVPGYLAPASTIDPATRVARVLVGIRSASLAAGGNRVRAAPPGRASLRADLAGVAAALSVDLDPGEIAQGMLGWTALFGVISFEIFGHYVGSVDKHAAEWFDEAMDRIAAGIGLTGVAL